MKRVAPAILLLFSSAVICGVFEVILRIIFPNTWFVDQKLIPQVREDYLVCYASDEKDYFPLDLTRNRDAEQVFRVLDGEAREERFAQIKAHTPHCLFHETNKRGLGFFPEREKQAAIVGDSFAFGEGVRGEDTLGYQLSLVFPEKNFKLFAWPGQDSNFADAKVDEVLQYHPDISEILYFYNLNDIPMSERLAATENPAIDFQNERSSLLLSELSQSSYLLSLVQSVIKRHVATKSTIEHYLQRYDSKYNGNGINALYHTLLKMQHKTQARGVTLHIILYPILYKDSDGAYPFTKIHQQLMHFCNQQKLSCVDGNDAFAGILDMKQLKVHRVDFHPNGYANQLVANYLGSVLQKDK